jgi:CHAD domain-containing protein
MRSTASPTSPSSARKPRAREPIAMSARERELKLAAPLGFTLPALTAPGGEMATGPVETIVLDATYYDTADLRLARSGASLRHRNDEGWMVKVPNGANDNGMLDRTEHSFDGASGDPPSEALELIRALARTAPIAPVAHLRTTRRSVRLRTVTGTPIAELTDDDVEVLDGDRLVDRFREIEIELADGAPEDRVDEIVGRLREAGARAPEPTPKVVRALGPRAQGPPDFEVPSVDDHASVKTVLRAALAAEVAKLITHDAGVRTGDDPEDIHQARVATRRLRSHLRTFRPVIDEKWARTLRDELKWLGGLLGAVRDAEVLKERLAGKIERLPEVDRPPARRLLRSLTAQRKKARDSLLAGMRSDRYPELLDRLVAAAREPALETVDGGRDAREVLLDLVRRPWRHLADAVDDLPDEPPDADLHAVRIRAKRARYAIEVVAPVFGKPARLLAKAITGVQDVLGEHQDAVVAADWLRGRVTGGGEKAVGFVAGQLVALEREDAERARAAWPAAWRTASRKRLRSWM